MHKGFMEVLIPTSHTAGESDSARTATRLRRGAPWRVVSAPGSDPVRAGGERVRLLGLTRVFGGILWVRDVHITSSSNLGYFCAFFERYIRPSPLPSPTVTERPPSF